jgi:hypothetical protein
METDTDTTSASAPEMDAMYYQCRSSRLAGRQDTLVSVSQDSSFGKIVTVQSPPIGSFEDHDNFHSTFHGSRVMKGNVVSNETISCSFDPGNLTCISCGTEHNIIGKEPIIVLFSDQNLFPRLSVTVEILST